MRQILGVILLLALSLAGACQKATPIAQAFCAGVWFGTNKVRFFGLEPYLNELRNQRQEITEAFMQLNVTSSPVTLGRNSLALDIIHTCQNVIEALEKALGQFKLTYEGNLLKWQKARKIH